MQRVLMLSLSAAVVAWAASAVADSPKLKGDYGFTGSAGCIATASTFNPNLFTSAVGSVESFAVEGTRTFNGDGTGSVTGTSMGVEFFPFSDGGAASSSTFMFHLPTP
jgi:hypothetical protein